MTQLILLILGVVMVLGIVAVIGRGDKTIEKPKYLYKRKQFFMSRAEHEFYDALVAAVGNKYVIFAQVHLPTLVDNKIFGQDWRAALAHINRKSVDFVLCDKAYISPKLAIELDDKTHDREDRKVRDEEVERILNYAGLPLLRVENHGSFDTKELTRRIEELIGKS